METIKSKKIILISFIIIAFYTTSGSVYSVVLHYLKHSNVVILQKRVEQQNPPFSKLQGHNTGQYISIPCHSQTRTKHADLVTLET